jgi:membrane-bound lytic murein transglycosylase D
MAFGPRAVEAPPRDPAVPEPAALPEPALVPPPQGALAVPIRAWLDEEDQEPEDEPQIAEEIEEQSAELEELREAEEAAQVLEGLAPEALAEREAERLGLESPLRQRLRDALGRDIGGLSAEPTPGVGPIALLPQITHDLAALQQEYDIPIDVNEAVLAYIRFFQSEVGRKFFIKWLGRSHKYIPRFREILREHGMPEDTVYLSMIESGFANYAYSRAKASGAWQFIAPTGKRFGLRQDFWVDERRDPEKAAHAAARYLKELHGQTGDWRLAWAGYNAGVGKIRKAFRRGQKDFWAMHKGRVLKAETKGYVPKLMAAAIISKHTEAFGFKASEIRPEEWMEYEWVDVPEATELTALALAAEAPHQTLVDLNPELRRSCTPPRAFRLKVPKGQAAAFARNWPSVPADAKLAFANHRVARGDSMTAVAAAYGVPAATITTFNGLKSGRRLRSGTELVIPLASGARARGTAPASEAAARARIAEYQRKNPSAIAVEPARRAPGAPPRIEVVDGRTRATVQVQQGDSLWAIARKFGVGVTELCRWNGIKNPRRAKLQIGQELIVYPAPTADARSAPAGIPILPPAKPPPASGAGGDPPAAASTPGPG